jgi:hypothetical protein
MSLHNSVETIKKVGIGAGIGTAAIFVLIVIFQIGAFLMKTFTPPQITPPNQVFGELKPLEFPKSVVENKLSFVLNTVSGTLPSDFPDRLVVYPLTPGEPSLLNLDKAREKARALRFMDREGKIISEKSLGDGKYEWSESTGISRSLTFNIVTFNFTLNSQYLASLTTHRAARLGDEQTAIDTVESFLETIQLMPEDVDLEKTRNLPSGSETHNTYPKLYNIINGSLVPTTSLSNAKVIRVDLYQKDIEYDLDTGVKDAPGIPMKLPIRYPNPPLSTMSFWVGSGQNAPEVMAAEFTHMPIDKSTEPPATYPIKTAEEAYEELKSGKAYIAAYHGLDQQILIDNIYLAYYLGAENQSYLMPIVVFEGQDGFFAYVSAIKNLSEE